MAVDINYWLIGLLFLATIALITWLIKHDRKDAKDFQQKIIRGEIKPQKSHKAKDADTTP